MKVLQSSPSPRPTTNPYNVMLLRELAATPGVEVLPFRWRTALFGRYDVFHVHWPETLLDSSTTIKRGARVVLTAAILTRVRLTHRPIVRTVHNVELPAERSPLQLALLRSFDRHTTLRIRVNRLTPLPPGSAGETILLGDYRDWYARHPREAPQRGRLVYFGTVRHYKGIEGLVRAFAELADAEPSTTLRIAGRPSTPHFANEISALARGVPRLELELGFQSDAALVSLVTGAELVVLPYRHMHNSSAVITALSLHRPVLVPDNEVNRALGQEVGPGWVHVYRDELTGADLRRTVDALRSAPAPRPPDLSARSWSGVGRQHAEAYRRALRLTRRTA